MNVPLDAIMTTGGGGVLGDSGNSFYNNPLLDGPATTVGAYRKNVMRA